MPIIRQDMNTGSICRCTIPSNGWRSVCRKRPSFEFIPRRREAPVVVYGTSIAQGGCASRPRHGMDQYPGTAFRPPGHQPGIFGKRTLEKEVLDFIKEIDASIYVLDCYPNLIYTDKEEVVRLTTDAVRQLRETRPKIPILICEHPGYTDARLNPEHNNIIIRISISRTPSLFTPERGGYRRIVLFEF